MADVKNIAPTASQPEAQGPSQKQTPQNQGESRARPQKISIHQMYALPVPLRTFPLPSFYPSNPLSLFHVLWAWTSQVLSPPPTEPSVVHHGYWSPETRSVHVRDAKSIRALWEQGFFGKGSYSRSEPNWLKREQSRQGQGTNKVSELVTVQRREERKMMKWDRARKEQEAILKTRLEEAWVAPVGPKELLALPNSYKDIQLSALGKLTNGHAAPSSPANPTTRNEITNGNIPLPSTPKADPDDVEDGKNGTVPFPTLNGNLPSPPTTPIAKCARPSPSVLTTTPKRRKSVRFSPNVESTTFQLFDPPSPHLGLSKNGKEPNGDVKNKNLSSPRARSLVLGEALTPPTPSEKQQANPSEIINREHLQLSPEETFYLVFALGALSVIDPATNNKLTAAELFHLFRQSPYSSRTPTSWRPDDPFLVQYAVYHHFRSLGWVPRSGIKFGVDWLLYMGGPVFSHAEFAVMVLPAYTHTYWKTHDHPPLQRSWSWLHSINRVQSHALKTMVIVYVDIPPPTDASDPATLLKGYKVREFFMKRWLSNRSR